MTLTEESRTELYPAEDSFYSNLYSNSALAALYAGTLAIPIPFEQWTGLSTGGATATDEETFFVFEPNPMRIIAMQKCRYSQWHTMPVPHGRALAELTAATANCTDHNPRVQRTLNLCKGLVRRKTSINHTQAIPTITPHHAPTPTTS